VATASNTSDKAPALPPEFKKMRTRGIAQIGNKNTELLPDRVSKTSRKRSRTMQHFDTAIEQR
jgi:hypothetical protein